MRSSATLSVMFLCCLNDLIHLFHILNADLMMTCGWPWHLMSWSSTVCSRFQGLFREEGDGQTCFIGMISCDLIWDEMISFQLQCWKRHRQHIRRRWMLISVPLSVSVRPVILVFVSLSIAVVYLLCRSGWKSFSSHLELSAWSLPALRSSSLCLISLGSRSSLLWDDTVI